MLTLFRPYNRIYPPEINPTRTRTAATSVSTCTNWISNFAVVMFTPVFIGETQWGAYLFFAVMNFIWVPLIFFFYPETAGRSLEEIDLIFATAYEEKKPAYRVAETMPRMNATEVSAEAERLGLFEDTKGKHDPIDLEKRRSPESPDQNSAGDANSTPSAHETA